VVSFNRACPDVPAPVIADSAVLLGPAWIGARIGNLCEVGNGTILMPPILAS
jgi:hypothetical protein